MCRCAFLPLDTTAPRISTAQTLRHAQPSLLIWADMDAAGGIGPLVAADMPPGCLSYKIDMEHQLYQAPEGRLATSCQGSELLHSKPAFQQLDAAFARWQSSCLGQPKLPYCYVMYTSGSTGKPAGVCGTEAGSL